MFFLFAIISVGFVYVLHAHIKEDSEPGTYVDKNPSIEEELLLLDSPSCACDNHLDYQQQIQNELWQQEQDRLYQEQVLRDQAYNDHLFQEQMMMDTFNDPFMNDPFF